MNKKPKEKYVTESRLVEVLETLATRDDLKGFATKDDLKGFATKDDLKGFATKDDLKAFATKDDLKGFATKDDISRIFYVLDKHDHAIQSIQETMATKSDVQTILNTIDSFAKKILAFDQEELVQSHQLVEVKDQVDDHEKRLVALEAQPAQ